MKVPSGVDEGTQLRFVGEGEAALVAARGNLLHRSGYETHPLERQGQMFL